MTGYIPWSPALHHPAAGFTLVELLVVVVVLSVIAAIVVPRVTASVDDTRLAALDGNLAVLRGAIERYRLDHGLNPGSRTASGATCAGRAGVGTVADAGQRAVVFAEQLTMFTSDGGKACSVASTSFRYGPYLKTAAMGAAAIPANPVTGSNTVVVTTGGDLDLYSTSTTGGWLYDAVTGRLVADHQDFDNR